MKRAFILTGLQEEEQAGESDYLPVAELFERHGYEPLPFTYSWKDRTHTEYVAEFINFYESNRAELNLVIGNSFGAMVGHMSAPMLKPDLLMLCSLSPFYQEDLKNHPQIEDPEELIGVSRVSDMMEYSEKTISEQIRCKTVIFYGETEKVMYPHLVARCKKAHQHIPDSEIVELAAAGHKMSGDKYLKGVSAWCKENL